MKHCLLLFFMLFFLASFSQEDTSTAKIPAVYYPRPKPFPEENRSLIEIDSFPFFTPRLMQPILGAGPSILMFSGDVSGKSSHISRIGYNLSISEYFSRSFLISARATFGTVGANEENDRNVNFKSSIRAGGLQVSYNFDKFLPMKRRFEPFVLTGFEYFEYLSKTDLFDNSGNKYYYWQNGSIMNLAENDPNASSAITLDRDYKYETDIRKWNNSLFGKYPERSFAVPVGLGVNARIIPRLSARLGATMHFSFTDYIDGVTEKNKGTGKGDTKKDKFFETYLTLTFDLFNPNPPYITPISDEDLLTLMTDDTDGDGVTDFVDSCQGTPAGVAVSANGCPPDSDGDGKPDYADKEVNSPLGAWVDEYGVAMTDSSIARDWRIWSDTADIYVTYNTVVNPPVGAGEGWGKSREATVVYRRELVVLLGTYKEGVPPAEMGKLLSIKDVRSYMQPDSTTSYISGSFNKTVDAEKRKEEMIAAGFPNSKVMIRNKDGSLVDPTKELIAGLGLEEGSTIPIDPKGVVFRVQLGAYTKKLSSSVFKNAGDVVELKTEDGLYKYHSGSYTSIQDAIRQKEELLKRGYKGIFVVAYKDKKRVPLSSVSNGIIQSKNENLEEPKARASGIDKNLISFRVQIGVFVNEPSADVMQKLNKIPGLEKKRKSSGAMQYLAGRFKNIQDARNFKETVSQKYGISDAFIIAFFKDEMISIPEALELLK